MTVSSDLCKSNTEGLSRCFHLKNSTKILGGTQRILTTKSRNMLLPKYKNKSYTNKF